MRVLSAFVAFLLTVVLAMLAGWLLHDLQRPGKTGDRHRTVLTEPVPPEQPALVPVAPEVLEFQSMLLSGRHDDALALYQHHENLASSLQAPLRTTLLATLHQWSESRLFSPLIDVLSRFTQYYYQDTELLKIHMDALEHNQQLPQAIELSLDARPLATDAQDLAYFNKQTHRLARRLFDRNRQQGKLDNSLALFQKLVLLEPDYSFYHYALAETYLIIPDIDGATRELEALRHDRRYGQQASRMLSELYPPVAQTPPSPSPSSVPIQIVDDHAFITIRVGEKQFARMMIDTGASVTTLPPSIIQTLKRHHQAARVGHMEVKTVNGLRVSPLFRVKQLQLGPFSFKEIDVLEVDMGADDPADGLLGMNVLGRFSFQIDPDKQAVTLTPR